MRLKYKKTLKKPCVKVDVYAFRCTSNCCMAGQALFVCVRVSLAVCVHLYRCRVQLDYLLAWLPSIDQGRAGDSH